MSSGRRVCSALDLIDDAGLIAAYEAAHAPGEVWPDVIRGIRASGVDQLEIWRTGDRLFMIAEVADDWPRAVTPELEAVDARWQQAMERFQRRLPSANEGEKWVAMRRIFRLDAPT
ncbi:L-rhamnose mutarotase [Sphingomonas sp. CFBP 13706]|uniref:L-rhamnose mutarotase n=1 Tax=Sphingomonas sp. CFBP 13706 TaxID=2775314 RepID=UPI0017804A78|nr:L-rhamnose mutarotase [Sphingomonas sp. CFBP 13706]MBD8736667.1 L-rhamnose mutarotase [Sphingomonas sp. CFBP 13706]